MVVVLFQESPTNFPGQFCREGLVRRTQDFHGWRIALVDTTEYRAPGADHAQIIVGALLYSAALSVPRSLSGSRLPSATSANNSTGATR
jgi:hypothetical protein